MKTIGDRISYEKHDHFFTIIISSKIEKWKENAMFLWLLAWSFCGATFVYFLFDGSILGDQKLALFIMLVFWSYLEVKTLRAYLWRIKGIEFIKIDEDRLTHKKSIFGYGKANFVFSNQISEIKPVAFKKKSFAKVFNESFWLIGLGVVEIKSSNNNLLIGLQLEENDAKKLSVEIKKMLKVLLTNK